MSKVAEECDAASQKPTLNMDPPTLLVHETATDAGNAVLSNGWMWVHVKRSARLSLQTAQHNITQVSHMPTLVASTALDHEERQFFLGLTYGAVFEHGTRLAAHIGYVRTRFHRHHSVGGAAHRLVHQREPKRPVFHTNLAEQKGSAF